MKDGFIRVAAVTPKIKVAEVDYNCDVICAFIERIAREKNKVAVFSGALPDRLFVSGSVFAG